MNSVSNSLLLLLLLSTTICNSQFIENLDDWNYIQLANQNYQKFDRIVTSILNSEDSYTISHLCNDLSILLSENSTLSCFGKELINGRDSIINKFKYLSEITTDVVRIVSYPYVVSFNKSTLYRDTILDTTLEYSINVYQTNHDYYTKEFKSRTFEIDKLTVEVNCLQSNLQCTIDSLTLIQIQYPKKISNISDIL